MDARYIDWKLTGDVGPPFRRRTRFPAATKPEARRRSAAVSRQLRLLRAHGIIGKLPHTHRYLVSDNGRLRINAILSAQRTTRQQPVAA